MTEPTAPWFRRVPWWLWVGFVVVLVIGVIFALTARGPAVEEVSLGSSTVSSAVPTLR